MTLRSRCTSLSAALILAGCAHSPPTTMLTLDPAPPAGTARAGYAGRAIVIPAVHVPAVLDRAEFVRQTAPGEVRIDDFARWAAPLGLLARDTLIRDLTARLPAGAVLPPGSSGGQGNAATLDVTILSFGGTADGMRLDVAYRLLPDGPLRQASFTAPGNAADPVGTARAFSALIGELADRLAADLPG